MYRWQWIVSFLPRAVNVLFLPRAAMSYRACLGVQRLLMILPRSFISILPRVDTRIQTAFAGSVCLVPASGCDILILPRAVAVIELIMPRTAVALFDPALGRDAILILLRAVMPQL